MKAALLIAAGAVSLTGCATYQPVPTYDAATVTVSSKAPFGTYLVDGRGRSLYILEGERLPSIADRCVGECLQVWPPLNAAGPTVAGPGVDPARLASIPMHGTAHAAYAGWPLYYYHRDRVAGDTTGQHVTDQWGTWHLLSPSGEPIRPLTR